jgi:hypothetical protein
MRIDSAGAPGGGSGRPGGLTPCPDRSRVIIRRERPQPEAQLTFTEVGMRSGSAVIAPYRSRHEAMFATRLPAQRVTRSCGEIHNRNMAPI